jgi:hypothetical protein
MSDKRVDVRLDKAFPVLVSSELHGEALGVARNISTGGMFVEMVDPLPIGCCVTVHFRMPDCDGDISARAEVKHHYCFNYSVGNDPGSSRGIGLRFTEFVEDGAADRFANGFTRPRVLH